MTYKGRTKEFFCSSSTKPECLELLLRKAFRVHERIEQVFTKRGSAVPLKHLIRQSQRTGERQFLLRVDLVAEEPPPEWHSKRSLSKSSGRKIPPQENEMAKGRFFIEDFQLFVAEIGHQHEATLFGFVFFDNMREAQFLGKKILRELVYEYGDRIEFYYSLYPSKIHTGSALLGPALLFSLFRGKLPVIERMFPAALNAIDEIGYLIKTMISSGELSKKIKEQQRNSRVTDHPPAFEKHSDLNAEPEPFRNLIKTTSYRSVQPVTETEHAQRLPYTPSKPRANAAFLGDSPLLAGGPSPHLEQSPIRTTNINEISF